MFSSLKLGRLFGIDLYIHPTFWLLPLFVVMSGAGASAGELTSEVLFVFAVFACVALHEFGHALAAASYGIRTRDITLYPVGGVASLEGMPEKPGQEIVVALAGPAVNVVIAVGLLLGLSAGGLALPWERMSDPIEAFVNRLLVANVFLVVFNLLPAFPMDGGRVLRALLATQMTRLRATEVAVTVGTVVAVLFFVGGFMIPQFSLMAIAVIVWLMGQSELASLRMLAARREMGRRARAFFGEPEPAPEYPRDTNVDLAARRFTGIAWDTVHGVWIQWVNGVPVRALSR
ncbi:Stage IV sporulation protein FB [Gemmata sp. SH-PL17]|uniref:M50 family metallopeptidase n=1 Tax=Gemmata sp. SH-PL17 TaxID=1630693 RepID=UPI00078DB68D|nr:M50 family metallopeptidase [Gemmata sp. SH-PL17]AMV28291.1 Stage IV sporulation protein FB [Gemmata sp. SH-PL17]